MADHRFAPATFHTTLGPHDPVLTIESGDRVFTTTVDAGGFDASDIAVTPGGNPQTGPFRVAGAEPGDTLAVHLEQIRPNRARGYTKTWVAANVLDPGHPTLPGDLPPSIDWAVDVEAGVASPLGVPELAHWRVPLAPMIGCFGVAPERHQAISTATSERHGGNMDWNGFQAGVTALFPVFEPGALFALGDVHAVQGDGEIVGTGIEISADVVFRVELLKGRSIGWPRARTPSCIATLGNARPLDQCVQHATTEMLRWLADDYGLDRHLAHIILGQAAGYQLGNMFDPAYTMVCTLAHEVLHAIAPSR